MTAVRETGVEAARPRSQAFLWLYALAYGGGVIAYVPLLTLLLPLKVEALTYDKVALLSVATLAGAVAASLANIAAGVLSDRTVGGPWGRRPWVAGGLAATLASFAVLHLSTTPAMLVAGVVLFQVALNIMLAPLIAIAADEAPDSQKGMVGGLFGAAYPLGYLAAIAITAWPGLNEGTQFVAIGALVLAGMLPFLLVMRRRGALVAAGATTLAQRAVGRRNLALVWVARLLIQIAGSILFAYFLFYFETVEPDGLSSASVLVSRVAWLSGAVAVITVPSAIVIGRLSDRIGTRKPFLVATAVLVTAGLLIMALMPRWTPAAVGYGLFACSVGVFLALQSTYAMQLLPSPGHRGRDLGILNLTNTIPAVVAPSLAYALVTTGSFRPLLLILAALTALAAGLMVLVRDNRPPL